MIKKFTLGLSIAALAIGGAAYADQHGMRGDADGNGIVTRAEAQSRATQMFARMDANGDGKLDAADREARMGRMFDTIDADHNGQISRDEFMAAHQDGPPGEGRMGMRGEANGHGKHHRGMGHGGMMKMAKMADTDKDGAISQAEFTAAAMQRFERADANQDGQVTREERQAARAAMKKAWSERKANAPAS